MNNFPESGLPEAGFPELGFPEPGFPGQGFFDRDSAGAGVSAIGTQNVLKLAL